MSLFFFLYLKLSEVSILLPFTAGIIFYKLISKPFRILFYYILITVLFLPLKQLFPDLFIRYCFTFLQMLSLSLIFYFNKSSKVIVINFYLFIIIFFLEIFLWNKGQNYNTISSTYLACSLALYSLISHYNLLNKSQSPLKSPIFWFATSILIYYCSNIFYFMMANYIETNAPSIFKLGTYVLASSNIVTNLLFLQSFRCFKNQETV